MIADLLQRAAVIYFHFNSDADSRGGERRSAIRHADPFPWWRFYMRYSKLVFLASLKAARIPQTWEKVGLAPLIGWMTVEIVGIFKRSTRNDAKNVNGRC